MSKQDKELQDIVDKDIQSVIPDFDSEPLKNVGLSPMEIEFIYNYLDNGLKQREAYSTTFGVTDVGKAKVQARKLMKDPRIVKGLEMMLSSIWQEALKTFPASILINYERAMNYDIADFYDDDGIAKPLSQIPADKRSLVENVERVLSSKTGAMYVNYILPSRDKAIANVLNLLKLRADLVKDDSNNDTEDAQKKREEIFNSVED